MALDVRQTKFKAYILDGFLAGLKMDAIFAAVIGGTLLSGGVGTPFGNLFGVLIKGTIQSLITTQGTLSSWRVRIVLSTLLCFFIILQSIIAGMKKKK